MRRVFGHGGLRLFILMLLDESPRHGYDLIRLIEDRFLGMYTPSAGTVYPRLQSLEDEGLIVHEEADGRKIYRLTDAGRAELDGRRSELEDLQARATESARRVAGALGGEMKDSVRELREEFRHAMRDARREERYSSRTGRTPGRGHRPWDADTGPEDGRRRGRTRPGGGDGASLGHRVLGDDLEAFKDDVLAAARGADLDRVLLGNVRDRLMELKETVVSMLAARPTASAEDATEV